MDLFNNQIGRNIGSESFFMLMMKVKFALDKGELRYLSNTNPRATSTSQLIPTDQWKIIYFVNSTFFNFMHWNFEKAGILMILVKKRLSQ